MTPVLIIFFHWHNANLIFSSRASLWDEPERRLIGKRSRRKAFSRASSCVFSWGNILWLIACPWDPNICVILGQILVDWHTLHCCTLVRRRFVRANETKYSEKIATISLTQTSRRNRYTIAIKFCRSSKLSYDLLNYAVGSNFESIISGGSVPLGIK